MTIRDVDAFVRRYARPVLKAAGYRNKGRQYMIDGPHGRQAILEFDPEVDAYRTGVELSYGVTTPAHRQFRESRGVPDRAWPHASYALIHAKLFSPEFARTGVPGRVMPSVWVLGDQQHTAEVGAAFATALEVEVLPRINSWFEPEVLPRDLEDPPRGAFVGLAPQARAVAVALLDVEGGEAQLERTLARLPADDMVREWIEARLETHRAS